MSANTDHSTTIASPLPQRLITDDPGLGGTLKERPEDFLVEEIPLYEPCGKGEHLYLWIEKCNVSHGEMISHLRRTFDVPPYAIGHAGMKDKAAITHQMISIHLPHETPPVEIDHERIRVLWSDRHTNKIRRGHLRGNRFSIRIRNVDPLKAPVALRVLEKLETIGVPTYYGSQRFGYRRNNHLIGAHILNDDWNALMNELLGSRGSPFPEHQRERRELYDAGRYQEAAALWTPADRSELIAIKALARGESPRFAARTIGKASITFWVASLISAAFNRVLDRRLDANACHELVAGDVAWKHDSRAAFDVTQEMIKSGELVDRLARFELSPSGPMWGESMREAKGATGEIERDALAAVGFDPPQLNASRNRPEGARRPLRERVQNIAVEGGVDERGSFIRTAFDLPRGVYATIALREVMKNNDDAPMDEDIVD